MCRAVAPLCAVRDLVDDVEDRRGGCHGLIVISLVVSNMRTPTLPDPPASAVPSARFDHPPEWSATHLPTSYNAVIQSSRRYNAVIGGSS
jgi:hypothetical protein